MRGLGAVVALASVVAACGSSSRPGGARAPAGSVPRPETVAWAQLRNPILQLPDRAVKDGALVAANGRWYALYSLVDASGAWRVGVATSADLRDWSVLPPMPHDPAVEGEASPDVTRAPDGRFVVTYQSHPHDRGTDQDKLYARTTTDFRTFSAPRPLARELHPGAGERMIDAALAWSPAGLLLGYKLGTTDRPQAFELARSASGTLDGPWALVGRPDISVYGDTIENYQFVRAGGRWQLVATSNLFDHPFLFDLVGDARDPNGWLRWSTGTELHVPQEPWNPGTGPSGDAYEHANSAFLVDRRGVDGYAYLLYSDAASKAGFGGEGHAVLAIARSRDLVTWTVPPG